MTEAIRKNAPTNTQAAMSGLFAIARLFCAVAVVVVVAVVAVSVIVVVVVVEVIVVDMQLLHMAGQMWRASTPSLSSRKQSETRMRGPHAVDSSTP